MAKTKYQKPAKSSGTALSNELLRSGNLSRRGSKLKVDPSNDLVKLSMGTRLISKGIDFGSPSEKSTKTSSSTQQSNNWTGLLESVASGGVSDLLGGGGILSAGLDNLTSGLMKFFGGGDETTAKPLLRFGLPETQDRAVYTTGPIALSGTSSTGSVGTTSYGSVQLSSPSTGVQKAQIVQTIKNALLTSSSLNDIIGEL